MSGLGRVNNHRGGNNHAGGRRRTDHDRVNIRVDRVSVGGRSLAGRRTERPT